MKMRSGDDGVARGIAGEERKTGAATLVLLASVLLAAVIATAVPATPAAAQEGARDEFGLIPEDPADSDLSLPDPMLDRTWPGPKPGDPGPRERIGSDDIDDEELYKDELPPPLPKPAPPDVEPPRPPRPAPPLVGPDGKLDSGSPLPEPLQGPPDVLKQDIPPLSDMEEEEAQPSPLDEGGRLDEELHDPLLEE